MLQILPKFYAAKYRWMNENVECPAYSYGECPVCGHRDTTSRGSNQIDHRTEEEGFSCPKCNSKFRYVTVKAYRFTKLET